MNVRFYPVIALLAVLFAAWLYLGFENGLSTQQKLDDLTRLPVYAYVSDTLKVAPVMEQLKTLPAIKDVVHETGLHAAGELIESYGLPLDEDMVADYQFPDVLTISFQPVFQAIKSRDMVLDILRTVIPETDIDAQSIAWQDLANELETLQRRSIHFHAFAGVLLLLTFVFLRLAVELQLLLAYKGKKHSVVDRLRHEKQGLQHTWTMLAIPLPACLVLYFGIGYLLDWPQYIPWWVFVVMAASALLGTLINHFSLHTFERETAYAENPVHIVETPVNVPANYDETPDS